MVIPLPQFLNDFPAGKTAIAVFVCTDIGDGEEAHALIDKHLTAAVPGTVGPIMTEPKVTPARAEEAPPPPVPSRVEDARRKLSMEAAECCWCELERPLRTVEVQADELGPIIERGVHRACRS